MSAIIAAVAGVFARELFKFLTDLIQKFVKKNAEDAASDKKIDEKAKETTEEMNNAHDPTKMDEADRDILSGG